MEIIHKKHYLCPIPVSYHHDYYSANGKWLTSANYEVKTHGSHMVNGEWVVDTYTKNGSMQSTDDNSIGIQVKVGMATKTGSFPKVSSVEIFCFLPRNILFLGRKQNSSSDSHSKNMHFLFMCGLMYA